LIPPPATLYREDSALAHLSRVLEMSERFDMKGKHDSLSSLEKIAAVGYKRKSATMAIPGFVKRFMTFDPTTLTLHCSRHDPEIMTGRFVVSRSVVISVAMDTRPRCICEVPLTDYGFTGVGAPTHFGFMVKTANGRQLELYFDSVDEVKRWKSTINAAMALNRSGKPGESPGAISRMSTSSVSTHDAGNVENESIEDDDDSLTDSDLFKSL
jgi:hypothetical protein